MAFSIRRSSLLHQVFSHVKADAAGADHRHLRPPACDHARHRGSSTPWVLDTRNVGSARADAGGEDHLVKTAAQQALGTLALAQIELDAAFLQPFGEVAQGLVELLLARDLLGKVELAADFARPDRTGSPDGPARRHSRQTPASGAPTTASFLGWGTRQTSTRSRTGTGIDQAGRHAFA